MPFKVLGKAIVGGSLVEKFESSETGMRVVLAQVPGPTVNGFFVRDYNLI